MKVLVCGGRDYQGDVLCLGQLPFNPDMVIHGDTKGAGTKAKLWAIEHGIHHLYMGSGSTGKAAVQESFEFIGIEKETPALNIAQCRINHAKIILNG